MASPSPSPSRYVPESYASAAYPSIELRVLNPVPSSASFPPLLNSSLLLAAASCRSSDRSLGHTPIWCHRQAGRFLPEFRAVRASNDFFTVCRTPELACEVTLQPLRRFPLDAAIIFSDILVVPQAMGMKVEMREKQGPVLPEPLIDPSHLTRLLTVDGGLNVTSALDYVMKAITLTRHSLQGVVPLIGFSGAPFTLMCYMIEGGGSKTYDKARAWFYKYPEDTKILLKHLEDVIIHYLIAQVDAGAQMLEVFDSWAGVLTPELFEEFIFPGLKRIAAEVKQAQRKQGKEPVPMTVFPKGLHCGLELLSSSTEFDVISIDWATDPRWARQMVGGRVALQGNLDVSALYADEATLRKTVRTMIDKFGPHGHIANLGHGMLPDHDPAKLAIFIDEVHNYSKQLLQKEREQSNSS